MSDINSTSWFLKIDDGTVFEAADIGVLQRWAAEGRVSPASAVSRNEKDWEPATSFDALDMIWRVRLPDGEFFGPLHIGAVVELLSDGLISCATELENVRENRTIPLRQWLSDIALNGPGQSSSPGVPVIPPAMPLSESDVDGVPLGGNQYAALDLRIADLQAERDAVRAETVSLSHKLATVESERATMAVTISALENERQGLEARYRNLENQTVDLQAERERDRAAFAELEAERERDRATCAELEAERDAARAETVSLGQQLATVESARVAMAAKISALENERQGLDSRFRNLENQTVDLQAERERDRAAFAELEAERDAVRAETISLANKLSTVESDRAAMAAKLEKLQGAALQWHSEKTILLKNSDALRESIVKSENENRTMSQRLAVLEHRLQSWATERDTLRQQFASLEAETDRSRTDSGNRIAHLEQKVRLLTAERNELRKNISDADAGRTSFAEDWNRERAAMTDRLKLLDKRVVALTGERDALRKATVPPKKTAKRKNTAPVTSPDKPLDHGAQALPRWWDYGAEGQSRSASPVLVVEPEIIKAGKPGVNEETLSDLHRLEAQAQAELAHWEQFKRASGKKSGSLRKWLNRKASDNVDQTKT